MARQGANNLSMSESTAELPSFGSSLGLSFLFLGLICLVGWGLVRFLGRRQTIGQQRIRIVSRVSIEPRRSLLIVEAGGRGFLLGSGESGISLIAEIDPSTFHDTRLEGSIESVTKNGSSENTSQANAGES